MRSILLTMTMDHSNEREPTDNNDQYSTCQRVIRPIIIIKEALHGYVRSKIKCFTPFRHQYDYI